MDDKKFPFERIPGIIRIVAAKNSVSDLSYLLQVVIDFLTAIPFPRVFMGDSKFKVSYNGCIMRARDAKTRAIKTIEIVPYKTTIPEVMSFYSYP